MIEDFLIGSNVNYVLGAYNEFYKYIDPLTNDTLHILGFEANITGGPHLTWNGYYKGSLFAKRYSDDQYLIEEINGTIDLGDKALVANRCYVESPFLNEIALYFGGFDPNSNSSTNMAWVFKKDYQLSSTDNFTEGQKNVEIYPNPTENVIYFSEKLDYILYNILGEIVLFGDDNEIDLGNLNNGVYIFESENVRKRIIKQ